MRHEVLDVAALAVGKGRDAALGIPVWLTPFWRNSEGSSP